MSRASEEQADTAAAVQPVRAAWIAGPNTLQQFACVLQPLGVGLMDEMVDVVLVCPQEVDPAELPSAPHEVLRYSPRRWWHVGGGAVESLAGELRKRKVDVVHGLDGSVAQMTRQLAAAAGVQYVLSSYSASDARVVRDLGATPAAVLACSEAVRSGIISRGACPLERIHLMRPGVYHVRHPTCFAEPDQSAAIVAGGSLADYAAFDAVVRCFAELSARKLDCVYFILGGGRGERRLRARAIQLGLAHDLTFVDSQPLGKLTGIFKAADLYVAPTGSRTMDVRPLLAIAAGVPVLAAAAQRTSDFLRDGETAMFFTPGDSAELTVKLSSMLDDRAATRALAESAIEYIHENHSPANNVTALAHIYRRTVAEAAAKT